MSYGTATQCEFVRSTTFMHHGFIRAFDLWFNEYSSLSMCISIRQNLCWNSAKNFAESGQECV